MHPEKASGLENTDKYTTIVRNPILRLFFKGCAILCILCGVVGAFLPVLPTTPFLLLAVFFSLRSSPATYQWLVTHPRFGPPLIRYLSERSISVALYWRATIMMWLSMLFAIWLVQTVFLKSMLFCIAVSVTAYMTHLMKNGEHPDV